MQIPVSMLFGLFIDLAMTMLESYVPSTYSLQVISLVVGCAILALGICLEVIADVTMVSSIRVKQQEPKQNRGMKM